MTPQMMEPNAVEYVAERHRERDRTVAQMHAAIGAALFEDPRELDIRLLWTCVRTSYFRVNWWTTDIGRGPRIRRSAFIRVERDPRGYRVLKQGPLAA
jgi:hypothetical protein